MTTMKKITLKKKHKLIIGITTVILLAGGFGGYAFYNAQVQASEIDEAQKAVQSLFSDTKQTKLADGLTERKLEQAMQEVDEVKNNSEKKVLQQSVESAESMLKNQKTAENAVIHLYQPEDKAKFADTVSNDTIKKATDLTNKVTNEALKKELTAQVADIDTKYKAYQTADKATNDLFKDSKKTAIKDSTKQENIDAVKKQVNVVANNAKKEALSKNVTKAQTLLDKRNQAKKEADELKQQQEEAEQQAIANEASNNSSNTASSSSNNDNATSGNAGSSSSSANASGNNNSNSSSGGGSSNSKGSAKASSGSSSNSSDSSSSSSKSSGSSSSSGGSSKSSGGSTSKNGETGSTHIEEPNSDGGTNIYDGW